MNYAISIKNLSKSYKVYHKPSDRLKEILSIGTHHYNVFSVLKNIELKISRGQTVGIIGQNGSGKSTLLQIICGILSPNSGEVEVDGRISALLELGAGFNPEFTGVENVYMNGAIQGFTKEEMDKRFPLIQQFAEIGDFINQPVKTYSSGMYVRLAFAAAINVDPDILIVDEALAVGDLYFQLKCIEKIKEFKRQNKTILYVTHDTYSVKNICDYAIWIHEGIIKMQGNPLVVVSEYEDYMKQKNNQIEKIESIDVDQDMKDILQINNVEVCEFRKSMNKQQFEINEGMTLKIKYTLLKPMENVVGGVAIFDANGTYICGLNTKLDKFLIIPNLGDNTLSIHYDNLNLLPGTYFFHVGFFEETAIARLDYKSKISSFNIISNEYKAEGTVLLSHDWEVS